MLILFAGPELTEKIKICSLLLCKKTHLHIVLSSSKKKKEESIHILPSYELCEKNKLTFYLSDSAVSASLKTGMHIIYMCLVKAQ